ncbi:MAG: 30S ribosomal protein S8, partial [Dehalococcoidia bacterium]|nr:30S ribosomal protein S8 [Dehalococcoidia bacterium]
MSVSDPIADMLTRIRNAVASRHDAVTIPASKMKVSIARVLKDEGFIRDYEVQDDGKPQPDLKVDLGYTATRQPVLNGLQRVSKPGLRVYVQRREIP